MWPDRISNPGPLAYESGDLPTALRGRAGSQQSFSLRNDKKKFSNRNETGGKTQFLHSL